MAIIGDFFGEHMLSANNISKIALIMAMGLPALAQTQTPRITGLAQIWYTQMTDNNLRHNTTYKHFPLLDAFKENGLYFKRVDIKLTGSLGDLDYEVMIDPTLNNNVLQDATIKYKLPYNIEVRLGQFKPFQTFETLTSSSEIIFAERAMMVREFGDPRDRGVALSVGFGGPETFHGRFHVGVFNGAGKSNETNAQNDIAARLEMYYGKPHAFGAYALQGSTNLADKGALVPLTFPGSGNEYPQPQSILDNKDKINNFGAYYRFQNDKFHAAVEVITGVLGRRRASLGTASGPAGREHLDQSYLGYVGTIAYTFGKHTLAARYDTLDYNAGSDWYGANPYLNNSSDFTPKYDEITLGYTYSLMPERFKSANIKVNYIMRSKNFLFPDVSRGQVGAQGGDTLVVAFQAGF